VAAPSNVALIFARNVSSAFVPEEILMLKRILLVLAALIPLAAGSTYAQGVCPLDGTSSTKLVCVLPQVYGPFGLGSGATAPLLANGHEAHFLSSFLTSFAPINEAVGTEVSQLPIASPSSGITFAYNPSLKTFAPSTDETLGPIIGERADTIGRNRIYFAFSFQYFDFNSIDGKNTADLPQVLQHEPFPPPFPDHISACPNQTGLPAKYAGDPCFVRDFVETINNIDLSVHQYTVYITYGITRRLDFSLALPLLNVEMKAASDATIVPRSVAPVTPNFPGGVFHQFNRATVPSCAATPAGQPCLHATFSDSGSASGVGDVVLRGKYELFKGERAGFALGVDVRVPSGDAENFLGSGTTGVKPFGVVSYRARISPHAEVGYEVNGKSILAGNFVALPPNTPSTKGSLPNRFLYIAGADVSVSRRLTGAFDIYGQRLFGEPQLISTPYTDLGKCSDIACTVLTPGTVHPSLGANKGADFNITNASLGLKFRPVGQLVITGNVLLKMDDGGLRSSAVPLVGVSYSF
jgi:hypothetical protein